jgi:peptide deformylase
MTVPLDIAKLGNPQLRQVSLPIYNTHEEWVQTLIDQMISTLRTSNGVGIAAPQVGHSHRLLIVASHPNARYPDAPTMEPTAMINPRVLKVSDDIKKDWEGCLSVPGVRGLVPRFQAVEVEYTSRDGKLQRATLTDFVARIFQHEFDHLEGLVFLDRIESTQDLISDQEYLKRISARNQPALPQAT